MLAKGLVASSGSPPAPAPPADPLAGRSPPTRRGSRYDLRSAPLSSGVGAPLRRGRSEASGGPSAASQSRTCRLTAVRGLLGQEVPGVRQLGVLGSRR